MASLRLSYPEGHTRRAESMSTIVLRLPVRCCCLLLPPPAAAPPAPPPYTSSRYLAQTNNLVTRCIQLPQALAPGGARPMAAGRPIPGAGAVLVGDWPHARVLCPLFSARPRHRPLTLSPHPHPSCLCPSPLDTMPSLLFAVLFSIDLDEYNAPAGRLPDGDPKGRHPADPLQRCAGFRRFFVVTLLQNNCNATAAFPFNSPRIVMIRLMRK